MRRVLLQTPERFRSLASTLLASRTPCAEEPALEMVEEMLLPEAQDDTAVMREVRLFHARVIEAVEEAVDTLVCDIAADVLGRELRLEPVDIEAIVDRALRRFAAEEPIRVRVHPDDVPRVKCGIPVEGDADLRPGDARIELRTGTIDASLGARLAALLQAAQ